MYIGANTNSGVNIIKKYPKTTQGRCGHDRMVVGFITNYAISAYHHCEFESHPGEVYSIQHYVIKFISDLRQVMVFFGEFRFPTPRKLTTMI